MDLGVGGSSPLSHPSPARLFPRFRRHRLRARWGLVSAATLLALQDRLRILAQTVISTGNRIVDNLRGLPYNADRDHTWTVPCHPFRFRCTDYRLRLWLKRGPYVLPPCVELRQEQRLPPEHRRTVTNATSSALFRTTGESDSSRRSNHP